MESNLFIELAEDQQEVVAGGLNAGTLDLSTFFGLAAQRQVATAAGPGGATTQSATAFQKIDTLGVSELKFEL